MTCTCWCCTGRGEAGTNTGAVAGIVRVIVAPAALGAWCWGCASSALRYEGCACVAERAALDSLGLWPCDVYPEAGPLLDCPCCWDFSTEPGAVGAVWLYVIFDAGDALACLLALPGSLLCLFATGVLFDSIGCVGGPRDAKVLLLSWGLPCVDEVGLSDLAVL